MEFFDWVLSEKAKGHPGNIEGLAKHLSHKYGGDPHFFDKAIQDELLDGYDQDAKSAIVARAHKIVTGIWPGEHGGKNPEGPG